MNDHYDRDYAVAKASDELSRAWALLSQERRSFELTLDQQQSPVYAEFSFVIPMTIKSDASQFAVGVLIGRADACTVASAMFGAPIDDVSQGDLNDACSEVCNIFASCIADHLYYGETIVVGLPVALNEANYVSALSARGVGDVYQSQTSSGKCLFVVVFKPTDSPH
jgi:hypothetical protein